MSDAAATSVTVYLEQGLYVDQARDLVPLEWPAPLTFQIVIDGVPWYRVRDAADGTPIYRREN